MNRGAVKIMSEECHSKIKAGEFDNVRVWYIQECENTMPDLSNLVLFCSGKVRKFLFTYNMKLRQFYFFIFDLLF